MTSRTITIRLEGEGFEKVKAQLDSTNKEIGGFGKALGNVGQIATGFLAAGVVQRGFSEISNFIGNATAAARESIAVDAQLGAVLKSTGGAAGVTADAAKELASNLEKTSKFEDEAVLGGENLLLTFTNIGKDTFPRATQAMVDMSQALGQDMKSSAIQLGKALNDPIEGVTALRRVGVSFTEEQLEQIKVMQEAGNVAGAQALILSELEKEFGGSALAASDAAGGAEVYKDKMNALSEQIGTKMIPIQEKLNAAKLALVTLLADKVIPLIEELYTKYWPGLSKAIQDVVAVVQEWWPRLQPIFQFIIDDIITRISGLIQVIQSIIQIIQGVVAFIDAIAHGEWSDAWQALQDIAMGIINAFVGLIEATFGNLPQKIADLIIAGISTVINAIQNLIDAIINKLSELPGKMVEIGRKAANDFLESISIAGVSAKDVGGFISSGGGLLRQYGGPVMPGMPYYVGESGAGRELFVPNTAGYIVPNRELGGGNIEINIGSVRAYDETDVRLLASNLAYSTISALQLRGVSVG